MKVFFKCFLIALIYLMVTNLIINIELEITRYFPITLIISQIILLFVYSYKITNLSEKLSISLMRLTIYLSFWWHIVVFLLLFINLFLFETEILNAFDRGAFLSGMEYALIAAGQLIIPTLIFILSIIVWLFNKIKDSFKSTNTK